MLKTKKVYVVGNQVYYANFITKRELVDDINDADIIIFTGGDDVDPSLYNCKPHPTTYSNLQRDLAEREEFKKIRPDQLAVGICRGSQFLCVINGGILIQNVENHTIRTTHPITEVSTDKIYEITSTHHQMQDPFIIPAKYWTCLFYSTGRRSSIYEGYNVKFPPYEPEIVLYNRPNLPKCLAIQGHLEYMRPESPIVIRINEIIDKLISDEN